MCVCVCFAVPRVPFSLELLLKEMKVGPSTIIAQMEMKHALEELIEGMALSKHAKDGLKNSAMWPAVVCQLELGKAQYTNHPMPVMTGAGRCNMAVSTWNKVGLLSSWCALAPYVSPVMH